MDQSCIFQYEAETNASYLVAVLPETASFIQYQMKMMENNHIAHLLEARKYQQDESVRICYNVTSRMSLRQVLERQKIRKEEFLTLLTSLVETCRELSEYQMTAKGLVLEEDYIFVRSGSFVPSFVYLPVYAEEWGLEGVRSFVRRTVLDSRIASTTDNFIQRLLDLVNDPEMTLERLEEELSLLRQPAAAPQRPQPQPVEVPEMPKPPVFAPAPPISAAPAPSPIAAPSTSTAVAEKKSGKRGPVKGKERTGSDASGRSILFTAVQAGAVLLLALAVKAGFFIQDGNWNLSYVAGALIALAGIDFVLYRELFVNRGKNPGERSAKSKAGKPAKKSGKKAPAGARSVLHPPAPRQKSQPSYTPPPSAQPAESPVRTPSPAPAKQPGYVPAPPVYMPPATPQSSAAPFPVSGQTPAPETEYSEDTVVIEEGDYGEGYLEYFENGLAMRIHLSEGDIRVGSRAQSVDHVLASHKVSKVHAEFVRRGDRYFVRDINSTNGTYLNGSRQRIVSNQDVELHDGDLVRLADIELTFKC